MDTGIMESQIGLGQVSKTMYGERTLRFGEAGAPLCDTSFNIDDAIERSSTIVGVGCGWLLEDFSGAFIAADRNEVGVHWTNDLVGDALADAESGSSLVNELLGGDPAWSKSAPAERDALRDSALSLAATHTMVLQNPVASTFLQELSEFDPAYAYMNSPNGTLNSITTLTDEEENILADLDELLSSPVLAAETNAACQDAEDGKVSEDLESDVSHWLSKSDEVSTASTVDSGRFAVPLSPVRLAQTPATGTGRRRGRKPCVSPSMRRERKRQQNREAAQRYRNRKHDEVDTIDTQLDREVQRNNELREELRRAETERRILLRFADRFDLRGLMREQLASGKSNLNTSLATLDKLVANQAATTQASKPIVRRPASSIVTIVRPSATPKLIAEVTGGAVRKRREAIAVDVPSKLARR